MHHDLVSNISQCWKGAVIKEVPVRAIFNKQYWKDGKSRPLPDYVQEQDTVRVCWEERDSGFEFSFKAAEKALEHTGKELTKIAVAPAQAIAAAAAPIPVVGDLARIASTIHTDVTRIASDAATAPLRYAKAVAEGQRLDKVAINALKDQVRIAKEAAPYAQTVISLVPGVGTGVSAAIGAGLALAEGKGIDEAAKAAIKSALPGGPAAAAAFETALDVAAGKNVAESALENARELVPEGAARQAFDIGLAVATGQNVQDALVEGFMDMGSAQLQDLAGDWLDEALKQSGADELRARIEPLAQQAKDGYALAMAAASQEGVGEMALAALRQKLAPEHQEGFDAALKAMEQVRPWAKRVITAPKVPRPSRKPSKKPPTFTTRPSPAPSPAPTRRPPTFQKRQPTDLERLAKLSPQEQEQLRQLAALKKLTPQQREALRALDAKAKAPAPPATATRGAVRYGPYPQVTT